MLESETKKYENLEDPGIRDFLIAGDAFYPADAVNFSIDAQRAFYDRYCAHFRKARPAAVTATDFMVGHIPCRRYTKTDTTDAPMLFYMHGGGNVVGGLDSHDDVCAEICDGAGIDVVGIHYRLAPEHPFPAAFEDCWAVLLFLSQLHPRLIVGGDSAGGGLAAAVSLRARDENKVKLQGQVLIYPGLSGDFSKGSYLSQSEAPGLSTRDLVYYRDIYKGGGSKFAEPLREVDYSGLPPAFLVAAGIDPRHDDCFDYAARLQAAGVPARVRDEPLLVHAFLRARHMSRPARASFDAIVAAAASLAHHGQLP